MDIYKKAKGRGSQKNTTSRFVAHSYEPDLSDYGYVDEDEDLPSVKTEVLPDQAKSILTKNNSPDIGFDVSINIYRGCEHGCSYCYARPTHEYLGLSAGLDFESKIFVKYQAPELLRAELMKKSWTPKVIAMSGVTDCYQPLERQLKLTRACLQVLSDFKNPVSLITKNQLICRDIDILSEMAAEGLATVCLSVTSLDNDLARKLEPRTSSPQARLRAIEKLAQAGIPVSVNLAPIIPGLTDHEIPSILKAAADAGASSAGMVPLRLPYSLKDLFSDWLEKHYPDRKSKVLTAIQDIRDGSLNDSDFGSRMKGTGKRAEQIQSIFKLFRKKYGLDQCTYPLRADLFKRPTDQLSLF